MRPFCYLLCLSVVSAVVFVGCETDGTVPPKAKRPGDSGGTTDPPTTPPSSGSGVSGVVVIDPGHGGSSKVGGSSANNATSYSGVLEKSMCLDMGKRVRDALKQKEPGVTVHMTRTSDTNVGLSSRAGKARSTRADILVSIHYNAFNANARGVETHVRPSASNVNSSADKGLARRLQSGMYRALRKHDSGATDRGVKETNLAVLNDSYLGNTSGNARTRACLVEIEFIDVRQVDRLLNISPNPQQVKRDIADAMADAIIADLKAN